MTRRAPEPVAVGSAAPLSAGVWWAWRSAPQRRIRRRGVAARRRVRWST
ncbi:hypothetical protein ACFPM0_15795 [Pseudonocardia sulfidoxydans]